MNILVTGGAGFIGSHLVEALLTAGHEVAVLDNLSSGGRENVPPGVRFFEVDIRDERAVADAFDTFRPDMVSHHASQMSVSRSVREPGFDAQINILGLLNIAASAARVGTRRIVLASSGGVLYGETSVPADEETPLQPISPYGISKLAGEQYLQFFHREHGLTAIALRYANVYGERQSPQGEAGVVAIFCSRMLNGETVTIHGDGRCVRDYVHVSDVVTANLLALTADVAGFHAVNVGTGIGTDVNQLAARLLEACHQERKRRGISLKDTGLIHGPPRPGDLRSSRISFGKAQNLFGWTPQVPLEEGICRTVRWFGDRPLGDRMREPASESVK